MIIRILVLFCALAIKECWSANIINQAWDKTKSTLNPVTDASKKAKAAVQGAISSLKNGAQALEDAGKQGGSLDKAQASIQDMFTKITANQTTISNGLEKNKAAIPGLKKLRSDVQANNKITATLKKDLLAALDNLLAAMNKLTTIFTELNQDVIKINQEAQPCSTPITSFTIAAAMQQCPVDALKWYVNSTKQQVTGGSLNLPTRMRNVANTLNKFM